LWPSGIGLRRIPATAINYFEEFDAACVVLICAAVIIVSMLKPSTHERVLVVGIYAGVALFICELAIVALLYL
jgi:hypothetical protein